MDFSGGVAGHRGHLDPSSGREVVFCHSCSNEWYNDEHGLECPSCRSEICEIITPDNDPRDIRPDSPDSDVLRGGHFGPHDFGRRGRDHYDDPDEEDIQDHFHSGTNVHTGPGGFMWSQRTFRNPERQRDDPTRGPGQQSPVDPSGEQEIFQRFQETLNMLTGFPLGPAGRSNREALFGGGGGGEGVIGSGLGTGARTTTYRSPSGHTSFTITTGAVPMRAGARGGDPDDGFDMVFGNMLGGGGIRPPRMAAPGLEGGLQNLFSILLGPGGPHAVHGDAVYSQEALDRIITQLMETNPQSNAAPPASEAAIEKLEKKQIDKEMMGDNGKAECTICIDEMQLGDEVTVLPCKHWFHGECVVLWLKEHNTCPVCRAPIEQRDGNNNGGSSSSNGDNGNGGSSSDQQHRRSSLGGGGSRLDFGGLLGSSEPWPQSGNAGSGSSGSQTYQARGARTPEEREQRLNVIRNLAGPSSYGQAPPDSPPSQRRDSWSPTSPDPRASASARNRSPPGYHRPRPGRMNSSGLMPGDSSQRHSRSSNNAGGNGSGGSSSNPISSWIRDRINQINNQINNNSNNNNNGNNGNNGSRNSPSGNFGRRRP